MDFFWSLFSRKSRHRYYARVDAQGVCLSFRHCSQPPGGEEWVEITEPRLCWLKRPLPKSACVIRQPRAITARQLLSI
ncbi:hypothetical protein N5D61_07335 [Pseudomonas sp. GD03842]|uniref:hypothetical protein n=1 Tax=unclassified Pseudomonas TaxID=196821 RepID=UPI000D38BC2B|nr:MULTISPECIES: hypothetical protein [unclassified Pseudomonas]MDH0746150.1 hypothetical protein [Pseudomonas sp. GD03842]RAU43643.1 hypothetical protein DBP26_019120 [Pseudomonas sp. RIT 409]RAU54425.1 hypothetical protein DBY65_008850 [Pseudomonas sp. RIT 412]